MSEFLTPVVYQMGIGGVGGFLVGYTIKKITRLIAIILGFFIIVLIYLGYSDIISVNYDKLSEAVSGLVEQAPNILQPIISNLPFAGSFSVGLTLGLKKG